ncbi:MAG: hypothetical protein ACRDLA_15480, partial [Thermoleophilaceae bacterium]
MFGGARTLVALAGMVGGLAFAGAVASAQLPPSDSAPEPVRQAAEPVQQAVQEPLPGPVEEVVQDSPVAPLREQVRGISGGAPPQGAGSTGPGGGGSTGAGGGAG